MTRAMSEHSRALVARAHGTTATCCATTACPTATMSRKRHTYLLFLKMADERTEPPRDEPSRLPTDYDWPSLTSKAGTELQSVR